MKKLISLLLVLCMAFSLMAMSVSAAEVPEDVDRPFFEEDLEHVYGNDIFDTTTDNNQFLETIVNRGQYALYMFRSVLDETARAAYTPDAAVWGVDRSENGPLKDIPHDGTELSNAIFWCYENGIVNGYKDGEYKTNREVTREETCAMLYRAIVAPVDRDTTDAVTPTPVWNILSDLVPTDNVTTLLPDEVPCSSWAEAPIEWCLQYGIIEGQSNGTFGAGETGIKQIHMAAILNRTENNEEQQKTTTKFKLAVESGDGYATIQVSNAYVMQVTLSEKTLNPANVTLTAEMNDVASLGITGAKKHSTTIQIKDFTETDPKLPDWMKETWKVVEGYKSTIVININGKGCQYNVTAEDKGDEVVFTFIPEDLDATRTAWQTLVNEDTIDVVENSVDDSKITIMKGSELQLGLKTLCFEDGVGELVLDNFGDLDTMEDKIRAAVKVDDTAEEYVATDARALITAGTALRVGQTEAMLLSNVEITVEGIAGEGQDLGSYLVALRDATTKYDMAVKLVGALDAIVSGMNGKTVTVNVNVSSNG